MSRPAPGLAVRAAPCDARNHTSTQPSHPSAHIPNRQRFAKSGGVGAPTRRSGSPATPAPLVAAAVAAAPTLAALPCRVVTRGEGTRIEDPSHQDRAGRGHMSLNPISSQSLPVLFIYLFIFRFSFLLLNFLLSSQFSLIRACRTIRVGCTVH